MLTNSLRVGERQEMGRGRHSGTRGGTCAAAAGTRGAKRGIGGSRGRWLACFVVGLAVAAFAAGAAADETPTSNTAPTGLPTISGVLGPGEPLTASASGIADADGLEGVTFAWQWIANDGTSDTEIAGATASTYTLTSAEVGKTIKARATFTDEGGTGETVVSEATAAVKPALTASFESVPDRHDGSSVFYFNLRFSDYVDGLAVNSRLHLTGSTPFRWHKRKSELGPDGSTAKLFTIRVEPGGEDDFAGRTLTTANCDDYRRICASDGRRLLEEASFTIPGPEGLWVATGSPIYVPENSAAIVTLAARTVDAAATDISWSLLSGADMGKVTLSAEGVLAFDAAKDYEAPDDADSDGDYEITVRVTDGVNTVDKALTIRLTDVDEIAPVLSSAAVDGKALTLSFSETLDASAAPAPAAFAVAVDGTAREVSAVSIGTSRVTLTLSSTVAVGATVTVGYTVPTGAGANPLKDGAGNPVAAFTGTGVTNPPNRSPTGLPTIYGSVEAGGTILTAEALGIADADGFEGATFVWEWIGNDGSADSVLKTVSTDARTPSWYLPETPDVGKTIKVRLTYTDDRGTEETLVSEPTAPVEPYQYIGPSGVSCGSTAISGTPQVGETLTVDGVTSAACSWQWIRNDWTRDEDIPGATGTSYSPTAEDIGKMLRVRVTYTDGHGTWRSRFTQRPAGPVYASGNTPASGTLTLSGRSFVGEPKTASAAGITDADGMTGATFSWQWYRLGAGRHTGDIPGATAATYTTTLADLGKLIGVRLTFTDDGGNLEILQKGTSLSIIPGRPTISGTPQVGETLTGSAESLLLWYPDLTWQWIADDTDISGATASTYTLTSAEAGKTIKVRASYVPRAPFLPSSLTSEATTAVNPSQTGLPNTDLCDRTAAVRDAIVNAIIGVDDCADATNAHLAVVRVLDLSNASISALQAGDFAGLSGLEELLLEGNDLTTLPADVFDGLGALKWLALTYNDLTALPAGVFAGLTALRMLGLGANDLTTLPAGVFDGLSGLKHLHLSENDLTALPAGVFARLTELQLLGLYGNDLAALPADVFAGLTALRVLHLGDNHLAALPAGVFAGLTALEWLALYDNTLTALPAGVFDGLMSLEALALNGNALTTLPADVFAGLTALGWLRLDNNRLHSLPPGTFAGIFDSLPPGTVPELFGNPWDFSLRAQDVTVTAGGTAGVAVTLSHALDYDLVLAVDIGGDAVAGTDYASPDTTLTVPAGQTSATLDVDTLAGATGGRTVEVHFIGGPLVYPDGTRDSETAASASATVTIAAAPSTDPFWSAVLTIGVRDGFHGYSTIAHPQDNGSVADHRFDYGSGAPYQVQIVLAYSEGVVFQVRNRGDALSHLVLEWAGETLPLQDAAWDASWDRYTWGQSWLDVNAPSLNAASYAASLPANGTGTVCLRTSAQSCPATTVTGGTTAPVITSAGPFTADENTTAVTTLTANDADTAAAQLTWSIDGGADAGHFAVTSTGVLAFTAAKNFEAPDDADGNGSYAVTVRVTDGAESDTADLVVTLRNVNEAPVARPTASPAIVADERGVKLYGGSSNPAIVAAGRGVKLYDGLSDPDVPETVGFRWEQTDSSGHAVTLLWPNSKSPTFTAPSDVTGAVTLEFRLRVTDAGGLSGEDTVRVEVVENTAPTGLPAVSGTAQVGETLTASVTGIADADGLASPGWGYQWVRWYGPSYERAISGATGATYTLTESDEYWWVAVRVTFTDDNGVVEALTSATEQVYPAAVENTAPTGVPAISGTARVGETLTASASGIADADGLANATFAWQWIANDGTTDADISGATGETYTLTSAEEGKTVKVSVTFTDDADTEETLVSEATAAVEPALLTARFGNVPGSHDGSSDITFELHFSEEFPIGFRTLRDDAFEVSGGAVKKANRRQKGSDLGWTITVEPDTDGDIVVTLPARACDATGAVCDGNGRALSEPVTATIPGPASPAREVSIAAQATALVTEGNPAVFTLTRTGGIAAALTVAVNVTETGAMLSGTAPSSVTFSAGSATAELSVATEDDEVAESASAVTATVSSGAGYTVDASAVSATVTVEDDDAAPVITSAGMLTADENATALTTLTATDDDTAVSDLAWSIAGGSDADKFTLSVAGVLAFKAAKDFEAPDDADIDGEYEVEVRVTDGANPVDASVTVRLADVDEVAPVLSSASVIDDALTLTFSELLDGNSVPASSAFTVAVDGTARSIDGVAVLSDAVTLTLASAVAAGEAVTVSYTAPTGSNANPLQDPGGNPVAGFSDEAVTNDTGTVARVGLYQREVEWPEHSGGRIGIDVMRTGDTLAALTVNLSVTETGTMLDGTPPSSVIIPAGSRGVSLVNLLKDDMIDEPDSEVTITVLPGTGYRPSETSWDGTSVTVTVLDDDEPPVITTESPILVPENQVAIARLRANARWALGGRDPAQQLQQVLSGNVPLIWWSLVGGADADKFTLNARGELAFQAAKDFENPDDADNDGDYEIEVQADDGYNTTEGSLTVRLTDVSSTASGQPAISGTPQVGQVLTATKGTIVDDDGVPATFAYQWVRVDGSTETDVSGATSSTYTLGAADVGKQVKVRLSFTDNEGNAEGPLASYVWPSTGSVVAAQRACPSDADWCATMTLSAVVREGSGDYDATFSYSSPGGRGSLSDDTVSHRGVHYTVTEIYRSLDISTAPSYRYDSIGISVSGSALPDGTEFTIAGETMTVGPGSGSPGLPEESWNVTGRSLPVWSAGQKVTVALKFPANSPPSGNPTISGTVDGTPEVGETLTASADRIADDDGLTNATFAWQWIAWNGTTDTEIDGATGSTYTLTSAEVGKRIMVRVTFTDDQDTEETLDSVATAPVLTANASPTGLPTISGTARVGETLTASADGIADGNGMTNATLAWRWLRNLRYDEFGGPYAWHTIGRGATYTLTAAEEGKSVRVSVTFTDDEDHAETLHSEATEPVLAANANAAPTGLPTISGTARVGETLTASASGIADADGLTSASFAWQWIANDGTADSDIADATGASYTLTSAEAGKTVKVRVTFTDDGNTEETLVSAATAAVGAANALPSGLPTISGTALVGETLTASASDIADADGLSGAAFAWQWIANDGTADADIAGATGASYTLTSAEEGKTVKVRVTFTDDGGTEESLVSAATAAVGAAFPVVSIAAAAPQVTEGAAAVFTLRRAGASASTLTVSLSVSEAGAVLSGSPPSTAAFAAGNAEARVEVATVDDSTAEPDARVTVTLGVGTGYEIDAAAGAASVAVHDNDAQGGADETTLWTATLIVADFGVIQGDFGLGRTIPAEWSEDGTRFRLAQLYYYRQDSEMKFSMDPAPDDAATLTLYLDGTAFDLDGVEGERYFGWPAADPGWRQDQAVAVRLARRGDGDGTPALPQVSVADASVREGPDAALAFQVRLSRAADSVVSVRYATADGTAQAGTDYQIAAGVVRFAAGETARTVRVAVLDDAHDEGTETLTFTLSAPFGAALGEAVATGTIRNTDPLPKAWLARFGRTLAGQVLDAVAARLEGGGSQSYVSLGGHRIGGGLAGPFAASGAGGAIGASDRWQETGAGGLGGHQASARHLLLGSAFHLVSEPRGAGLGPRLAAWGRVATGGFDGRDDYLSLDGTVTTLTLGVDSTWERWLTGTLLAYSEGEGSLNAAGAGGGSLESTLTSLHPYVGYTLNDRLRLWGTLGYGSGNLRLRRDGGDAMDTDLQMSMGALGLRGTLLEPSRPGGAKLSAHADVLWVRVASAAVGDVLAAQADVTRVRLLLEGSWSVGMPSGGLLTPLLRVGLRHDGGDGQTGSGVEVGGGLVYASPWGLSLEASARALVAHEAAEYRDWGAGGALRYAAGHDGLGLTASIAPTLGSPSPGMASLLGQPHAADGAARFAAAEAVGRLQAEMGYGVRALHGRGLLTPYARAALVEGGGQSFHLGTRLTLAESLDVSLEGGRRGAGAGEAAAHEVVLRTVVPW